VPLVVTEGNYLLDGSPPWDQARALMDEIWYVELDEQVRVARLIARNLAHGRSPAAAAAWVAGVDQPNAARVETGRERADLVVRGV
jgi:pantothenate kinase